MQMSTDMHLNLVKKAEICLKEDKGFLGMAIGGSWIDNKLDQFSDLDLYLIMDNALVLSFEEKKEIQHKWGNLLTFYINGHDENVTVSLYDFAPDLLHVDCKWIYLEGFQKRVENPSIIFEKDRLLSNCIRDFPSEGYELPNFELNEMRFWSWMHYIFSKIGRGEIIEAYGYLCEVRNCCVGPMVLHKNALTPRRMRHAEHLPEADLKLIRKSIPINCDAKNCFDATIYMIELYKYTRDSLVNNSFVKNYAAEIACLRYAENIKNIIRNEH
jgi:hypothetical protein